MDSEDGSQRQLWFIRVIYFFYFAGFGIYTAYVSIYYLSLGLSGIQIGYLISVVMLVGLIVSPLWGYLNDLSGKPRLVLATAAFGAAASVMGLRLGRASFNDLLMAASLFGVFYSAMMPLIDRMNMRLLGSQGNKYARQRIWGSIGFILVVMLAGKLFEIVGLEWMFAGMSFFFLLVGFTIILLPSLEWSKTGAHENRLQLSFFARPPWLLFMLGVFILGLSSSWMNNFLGVHMHNLGGSESLIGLSFSIGAVAELPIMYFSPQVIKRFGISWMIGIAIIASVVRYLLYAVMPNAEWAVPISILNGLTFAMYWIAAVVFVNQISPETIKSTSQGFLASTMGLAGVISGPIGGWFFDQYGGPALFVIAAAVVLISLFFFQLGFSRQPVNEIL